MNRRRIAGWALIGAGLLVLTLKLSRVYDPVLAVDKLRANWAAKASPGIAKTLRNVPAGWVVYGALVLVPWGLGALLLFQSQGGSSKKALATAAKEQPSRVVIKPGKRPIRKAAIHSCNVLRVGADARNLWQFDARNGGFILNRELTSFEGEPLPANLVTKDWHSLYQKKLNIAWLPPEHVFLRVAEFPQSEFNETLAMAELQMEKLSPMPVAQVVWSLHVLPQTEANMQRVIVMIVGRSAVEEFLGKLEGQGYLADRLELPLLDQLQATEITGDGAWIYPEAQGGKNSALVAWWYDGALQNLDLITLPAANRAASLREQLMQMAWAGEMEGWMKSPPRWHLVADAAPAAEWQPALQEGVEQPVEIIAPLARPQLAALTARRAANAEPRSNLLPAEFATRYQQQFVDRLWMRGLLAVGGLYLIGVLIYVIALEFALFRTRSVEHQVAQMAPVYTNAIQLKARFEVLKERQDLKYAALDCWQALAEVAPDTITLDGFTFSEGKRLQLNGTMPSDQAKQLIDFESAMRKARKDNQPLFDQTQGDTSSHIVPPSTLSWNFSLELARTEAQ